MIGLDLAGAAVLSGTYNCEVQQPRALHSANGVTQLDPINFTGFGPADWRFTLKFTGKDSLQAEVNWPKDPMQVSGKFPALVTANGAAAFTAYSSGPCMFTESMCVSIVNLVDHGDGTADVIILPAAVTTIKGGPFRKPFVAVAQGNCTPAKGKK